MAWFNRYTLPLPDEGLLHDEKSEATQWHVELPLDKDSVDRFEACMQAEFPICLDRAVKEILGDKEMLLQVARRAGLEEKDVASPKDIWNLYVKLGDIWKEKLGHSVKAVIDFGTLKVMESMGCTKCPLYELELKKKEKNYSD